MTLNLPRRHHPRMFRGLITWPRPRHIGNRPLRSSGGIGQSRADLLHRPGGVSFSICTGAGWTGSTNLGGMSSSIYTGAGWTGSTDLGGVSSSICTRVGGTSSTGLGGASSPTNLRGALSSACARMSDGAGWATSVVSGGTLPPSCPGAWSTMAPRVDEDWPSSLFAIRSHRMRGSDAPPTSPPCHHHRCQLRLRLASRVPYVTVSPSSSSPPCLSSPSSPQPRHGSLLSYPRPLAAADWTHGRRGWAANLGTLELGTKGGSAKKTKLGKNLPVQ